MSHALATVLHRGRKAASNVMAACLASSREASAETAQNDDPGCSRNAFSSGVDSRPRIWLRWGKRANCLITSRCLTA